jgi:hypothetical protein
VLFGIVNLPAYPASGMRAICLAQVGNADHSIFPFATSDSEAGYQMVSARDWNTDALVHRLFGMAEDRIQHHLLSRDQLIHIRLGVVIEHRAALRHACRMLHCAVLTSVFFLVTRNDAKLWRTFNGVPGQRPLTAASRHGDVEMPSFKR